MYFKKALGSRLLSSACLKYLAAPSIAPPKRGPIVKRPVTSDSTTDLPARAVTLAL